MDRGGAYNLERGWSRAGGRAGMQSASFNKMIDKFTVTTWNVNGVKDRVKQQKVLQHLKKNCPQISDIAFLQELHLKPGEIKWLKKQWVDEAYESNYIQEQRSRNFNE